MTVYRFKPIIVEALWGYEKWMLSSIKGRESTNLKKLVEQFQGGLLGKRVWEKYGAEFPLLIKFIHTQDKLSVQVHPTSAKAAEMNRAAGKDSYRGKTEMWYITKAEENANLLLGLSKKVSRAEFKEVMDSSQRCKGKAPVEELLTKFYPKAGESYFVQAGTVHSLGAGLELFEIQQSSDTTFRLYDFNRIDKKSGKPRRLDVEEALQCIDYSDITKSAATLGVVSCEYFTVTPVALSALDTEEKASSFSLNLKELDSFSVIIATEGEGLLDGERIAQGDLILIPADIGTFSVTTNSSLKFLEIHV